MAAAQQKFGGLAILFSYFHCHRPNDRSLLRSEGTLVHIHIVISVRLVKFVYCILFLVHNRDSI